MLHDQEDQWKILEKILEKILQLVQSKDRERISMEDYMRQQIEAREEEVRVFNFIVLCEPTITPVS